MKNFAKMIVVSVFGLVFLFVLLSNAGFSGFGSGVLAQVMPKAMPTPTPPAANTAGANKPANIATNTATNAASANANVPKPPSTSGGDKKIPKSFTLGKDSLSEYGEVPFDHDTHANGKYSPDGNSVVGCVECHHTDAPKSALKPPYLTSERDVALTMASWQASTQKVNECRHCHFQDGSVPDGKDMPVANGKDLTNELAYHINCNTCHDAAFAARPSLKSKPGFATSKDCTTCHKPN